MRKIRWNLVAVLIGLATVTAQAQDRSGHSQSPPKPEVSKSVRITTEALHKAGGVPRGWKFTLPPGDAAAGRKLFADLGCHSCHEVKGEQFPPAEKRDGGPELTGMGSMHPAEYLAEAIVNPNAVIIDEPGFTGPDRLSKMPSFNDDLTVTQLINLVAYLKSLTGGHPQAAPKTPAKPPAQHGH